MKLQDWLKSEIEYSQTLVHSAVNGARCAGHRVIAEQPPRSILARAARNSVPLAAVGACVAPLAVYCAGRRKAAPNELLYGLLGAAIGFSAVALCTSPLVEEMAHSAVRNLNSVRDAHWLAHHPIDYA